MTDAVSAVTRHHDRLLIVDFGSQVTQLIARRLRELRVYCEIHPYTAVTPEFLDDLAPRAVILSGGPASVLEPGSPRPPAELFQRGVPVLGICYGQQVMMEMLGGRVEAGATTREFGRAYVSLATNRIDLLNGWFLDGREQVWMSHGDHVAALAPGFEVCATSDGAPFAVTADTARGFYAVQFHPEVHHTPNGARCCRTSSPRQGSPATGRWTPSAPRRSPRSARKWAMAG